MNVLNRVEKLENVVGVNEPYEVCEVIDSATLRIVELMKKAGVTPTEASPSDLMTSSCAWCLRPVTVSLARYSPHERELYERLEEAYDAGTLCASKNATLYSEIEESREKANREDFGEHYGAFMSIIEGMEKKLAEIAASRAPRKRYICRVEGCLCEYPKSEKEWIKNVRARGIAA